MKTKWISFVVGTMMTFGTSAAFADHTETIIGAAVGGAAGAAIGNRTGGRNDAVIWSAIGGATGAALGRSLGEHERHVVVRERVRYAEDDHYVVVHRPVHVRQVYYEERPRYYNKMKHHNKHHRRHGRDWDDD